MNPQRVRELFEALCDAPPETVRERLGECSPEERRQVQSLLDADARGGLPEQDDLAVALAEDLFDELSMHPQQWHPPTSLPGLELLTELGRGGMGIVMEARQERPERLVAVKFLGPAYASTVQEAQALAELRHPSIPVIFEVSEHDGVVYLVMERIHGRPLRDWAHGRSESERLRVFLQICDAVEHAHRQGVLHRDLKPDNLLAEGDRAWVLDFGLATSTQSESTEVAGTLPYLADELLDGAPASPASEVFSLGVVLAELLGLDRPTTGTRGALAAQRRQRADSPPWERLDGAPPVLESILRACLCPRDQRYPSVHALAQDIRAHLTHHPVSVHSNGVGYRLQLLGRRRWRELSVAAVLTIVLGGTLFTRLNEHLRVERAESTAAIQLASVETALQGALHQDDVQRAQQLVDDVLTLPTVRGTRASANLLRELGRGLWAAGEDDAGAYRLAEAFVESTDADSRAAVARDLVPVLIQRQAWGGLPILADHLPEAEGAILRRVSSIALLRSDPDTPLLASAKRLPFRSNNAVPFETGLQAIDYDRKNIHHFTPTGHVIHPVPDSWDPGERPSGVGRNGGVYWSAPRRDGGGVEVWRTDDEGSVQVASLTGYGKPTASVIADPDGDGQATLYVGLAYPSRTVRGVDLVTGEVFSPAEVFDTPNSDNDEMMVARGATDELVIVRGGWRGFDLLTLGGSDRDLEIVDRGRTGAHVRATLVNRDGTQGLAFRKTNDYPTPALLGRGSPNGMDEGLYLFERDGLTWSLRDREPLARVDGTANEPLGGDFDGDGWDDLLFTVNGYGPDARLQRLDENGFAEALWIHQVVPLTTVDFDGDGDVEVAARVQDDDQHVWLLGHGDTVLPPVESPPTLDFDADVAGDAGPWLAAGLHREALPLLEAQARITSEPLQQKARWRLVARLARRVGQDRRALDALAHIHSADVEEERLATRRALHDFGTEVGSVQPDLPSVPPIFLDFRGSLPSVDVEQPAAMSMTTNGLDIDMTGADGVLWRMPIQRRGDHLAVAASIDWVSGEIGAQLDVVMVDAQGKDVLGLGLHPFGGGRSVDRRVRCLGSLARGNAYSLAGMRPQHTKPESIEVRASHYEGTTRCDIQRPNHRRESIWTVDLSSIRDAVELQLRATSETGYRTSQLRATVEWIRVEGVLAAEQPPGPEARWVVGDRSDLEALLAGPHRTQIAVALGDIATLKRSWTSLEPLDWVGALRRNPTPWFIAMADDVDALAEAYAAVWTDAHGLSTPEALDQMLAHPLVDQFDPEVSGVRWLLAARASSLLERGHAARALAILERLQTHRDLSLELLNLKIEALELLDKHSEARALCSPLIERADLGFLDRVATRPALQAACAHPGNHVFMDGSQVQIDDQSNVRPR